MTMRKGLVGSLLFLSAAAVQADTVNMVQADTVNMVNPPCPCRYEVQDEGICESYSKRADGNGTQNWPVASDACLEILNISKRLLPDLVFWSWCPFPNLTGVVFDEMVSFLKSHPEHPISQELMKQFSADTGTVGHIFVKNPATGFYQLPETMLSSLFSELNCNVSPTLCWNEVKTEWAGRVIKMNAFCASLNSRQVQAYKDEQGLARMRLCEEPEPDCEPLTSRVAQLKQFNSNCSQFATTVANEDLPICNNTTADSNGEGINNDSGAASHVMSAVLSFGLMMAYFFL